jgi:hypothetical protein
VTGRTRTARLLAYGTVSTALSLLSDRRLGDLVDSAAPAGAGIGGPTAVLDVEGVPVFVKRVPLSVRERQPGNVRSTADLFGLPAYFHYGLGSPGAGGWRELAAQLMTTNWVLAGECASFPLLYHWRVLPHPPRPLPEELADTERVVRYWGGSAGVRQRLAGLAGATASVVLFLEYFPQTLHEWLRGKVAEGGAAAGWACAMAEANLRAAVSFMNARGMLHFDAHSGNILTDGRRLYLTDFGLAVCPGFELSAAEAAFVGGRANYDRWYALSHLVEWLVTELTGERGEDRAQFISACANGAGPDVQPAAAGKIIKRWAPAAEVMTGFWDTLRRESRSAPYPAALIDRACAAMGDAGHWLRDG